MLLETTPKQLIAFIRFLFLTDYVFQFSYLKSGCYYLKRKKGSPQLHNSDENKEESYNQPLGTAHIHAELSTKEKLEKTCLVIYCVFLY